MKNFYFAYGSNTNSKQINHRLGKVTNLGKAIIEGYEFSYDENVNGSIYANVKKKKGKQVEGVLYMLNDEQLHVLDGYEGFPYIYERLKIEVKSYNQIVYAYVYVMTETFSENKKPTKKYFDTVYAGYCENDLSIKQMRCRGYVRFRLWNFEKK